MTGERQAVDDRATNEASPLWRRPALILFVAAVALPTILFILAAWTGYRDTMRSAGSRVERTTRVLEEHASKVFETHRMVIQQVRERLRFVDWSKEADKASLHQMLRGLEDDLDQVATITIVDAQGHMLASGRTYPADPKIDFADRDWFTVFRDGARGPFISRAYLGRQSKQPIFNLAVAQHDADGRFSGVIAVSIDRHYFEAFYREIEPEFDHSVTLVRGDGELLARIPATATTRLGPNSHLLGLIAQAPAGQYTGPSSIDGVDRVFAYRKIADYPVYVRFGISVESVLGAWKRSLIHYGLVALLTSCALVVASWYAVRQTGRERLARRRWQETAVKLEAEVAERERVDEQLRQMQKMEAIGRLTGGIAHDFNNLLTAVLGNLELAGRRIEDARVSKLVANAVDGAQRAATLTSRLLAFSRQQPLQPKRIAPEALVLGMSDLLRVTLGETIAMRIESAGDTWPVAVDASQLESAILNLAVNARDAMPNGGTLVVETRNLFVDAGSEYAASGEADAGAYAEIAVRDTGEGMTPEVLAKVFEPFFTTKPVGKGTGLGLSQVYGFARQSGGRVVIRSTPGAGTSVNLLLPRLVDAALPEPETRGAIVAPRATRGETVLIVEDEPMVLEFAGSALREAGYRVLEAGDGPEALTLLAAHAEVGLIVTDVILKGPMDGRSLAQAAARRRDIPVLYISGYSRDAIQRDGKLDKGVDLLTKPFTSGELNARVRARFDLAAESKVAV